ncbi:MAG: TonB-dependent receptor [Nitrospirales bacterium]|nr:TonB-dependent receptor [Nitrospira sp.]MDR4502236.1 TonB-dependent receptor [Nitrospirales bacterium]
MWLRDDQIRVVLRFFWVLPACVFFPCMVFAASEPDPEVIQKLEPVVVTDTKTPTPISEVTSAVEMITEEDIRRRNDRTLVDALGLSQGAAIFSTGGYGGTSTFRIRGGASGQTLVLIDGAIINSATLGEANFGTLTTDNIESITVLRGAQSMLYGSDAMGGVVDIRTKRGEGAPVARIFSEYGSFNSLREGGSFSGQMGPVDMSIALSRWDMAKFSSINYRRGAGERDAFRNWQGSSLIGMNLPWKGRLELAFRWVNQDIDIDNPSTFGGPFDVYKAKSTSRQYIYSGTYHQPMTDWWDQKITLSQARETGINQAGTNQMSIATGAMSVPPDFGNSDIRTKSNRIEWQSNFYIGKPVIVTVGYQFREQLGKNKGNFSEHVISSHAGFAQMQVKLFDRLFGTAGFRQDSHNTAGSKTTYRFTGGYLLKETGTKVRGSYATGFRTPDINELYFPNFGNPTLVPETSKNFDVAVDQTFLNKRVTISAGYFWSRYKQLIVTAFDPVGCAPFTIFGFCAQNVGKARAKGVETSLKILLIRELPFLKRLDFDGQYTYTSTRDLETGTRLARWPVHQASATLTYQPVEPLRVTGTFRYVGSRFSTTGNQSPLPHFYLFNLAATYQVNSHLEVYTRVENLADRKYEEVLFFGTPGRSIWGGVRVNFEIPVSSESDTNE